MASKYLTPFTDEQKQDILDTLKYIQSLKDQEAELKKQRKEAENWLMETLGYDATREGTVHYGDEDNFVTFSVDRDYKVDTDKLGELIQQNQISEYTSDRVFRWKAEVNATEWKNLGEDVKTILAQAVTSKTGSPSIKINLTKEA